MKIAIIFACLAAGTFAFSHEDIKFDELVPIYETVEFKQHYPAYAQLTKEASFSNHRQARIWNGRLALQGELPYQAGIVVLLSRQAFCGGSIVSNNFVLSAASCFPGDPNAIIEIGNINRNLVQTFINAAEKRFHPGFDASANANDLVLIRTVVPIVFNDNVRAVRLPNRRQVTQSFENREGRISGWGATGTGDSAPNQFLRVAFARVISQLTCRIRFPNSVTDNTICLEGENVNFCTGDFGGPLTIQDADTITTQIGVKSFLNILGCTQGWPGGFTRLSRYLDWIGANSDVVIRDDF